MQEIGVVHGRFQPFHNDHLKYVLESYKKVDYLYIGITNPDPGKTKLDSTDINRSKEEENPFTYFERLQMINAALEELKIKNNTYCIVPFPINFPELIKHYTPENAEYFLTIYDEWGNKKLETLNKLGLKTNVLWKKQIEQKGIKGSNIRKLIMNGLDYQNFVPGACFKIIENSNYVKKK